MKFHLPQGLFATFVTRPYWGRLTGGYVASPSATPKFRLTAKLHISPERYAKCFYMNKPSLDI